MKPVNHAALIISAIFGVNLVLGRFFTWYDSGAVFVWLVIVLVVVFDLLVLLTPEYFIRYWGVSRSVGKNTRHMVYLSLPFVVLLVCYALYGMSL